MLTAVSLVGCGGGGGGGGSSVSLGGPALLSSGGGGTTAPSSPSSGNGQLDTEDLLSYQFSGSIQYLSAGALQAKQGEEVYAPDTQSSMIQAFVQAGQGSVVAGRSGSAYLIADSTYGVATAAQDFLAGAGLAADAYTYLDTQEKGETNRSTYLETQENSIVNILSSPLYTSSSGGGLGALILSPEDVEAHGWIVSDTGFDGNIDPIAGISGRAWLGDNSESVAAGYRNAIATGKVRLFYGLNADEQSRHSASNGCQGVEDTCMGTPYSLRVKNARGRYIDVEGTFVSTYGFAAYVMAWERMAEDTHISEVFAMGDACTVDLGDEGADADTGLGRLDIGCLARRAYESQLPPPTVPTTPTTVVVTAPTVDVVKPKPVVATVSPEPAIEEEPVAVTVAVVDPAPTVAVIEPKPVITSVSLPVVDELPTDLEKITYWDRDIDTETLTNEFKRLGLAEVTANRQASSYMIRHDVYMNRGRQKPISHDNSIYRYWDTFEYWLKDYEFLRAVHNFAAVDEFEVLPSMGLSRDSSYTHMAVGTMEQDMNYDDVYRQTGENSLVHFETNPFYLGEILPRYRDGKCCIWNWEESGMHKETWLDSDLVPDHGWIVSETGFNTYYVIYNDWQNVRANLRVKDYRLPWKRYPAGPAQIKVDYEEVLANGKVRLFYDPNGEHPGRVPEFLDYYPAEQARMKANYEEVLATGKVRLFYGLNGEQTGRDPVFLDCTDFEEYCIGVPHGYNSHYGFGAYLKAWERMPEETHISAVFAMGDRCVEDLGAAGPDADTGLGRLDIGCMAYEVYKVNLDPTSATLSVAARTRSSATLAGSSLLSVQDGNVQLQGQSAPPAFVGANDDPARQQFFDDFAQDLFSHLGSLWLPGSTQAGFSVGFPGDSFEGTYRPTHGVGRHYDVQAPSPRYALAGGSVGVMGMASGEVGIFTRFEGMDISFSYARSEDFFGGTGSGDFRFDSVGNSRLMVHRQMLPGVAEHSLVLGSWVRHAAVAGGKGRLLDDLRGVEYGLSMNYGWQRPGGLKIEASATAARFAGGEVELAGGNRFAIGSSDWQWGVGIKGSYEF